ncbi:hypothetical protein VNO77_43393 [Canavalia gladiata]|uniref:Wound-induced protein 1 n=1 Tax=Canavalia gladiata TaxID=3824 RepID=A0AAN9JUR0_CANGL
MFTCIPELANSESQTCLEERNKRVVKEFYKALTSKQTETLHQLLAPHLEWWFHGPPRHRHLLVPCLTGSSQSPNPLHPEHVVGFGSVVIAEGYDETNLVWWVHAWTVTEHGVITQVKEYVNTSVTVTRLGMATATPSSSSQVIQHASDKCQCIWQSTLCDESVPGLILAV